MKQYMIKHSFWNYAFTLFLVIGLTSCMPPKAKEVMTGGLHYKPLNLLPMYGADYEPYIKKTEAQKEKDREFIASVIKSEGSREVGAKLFAGVGWQKKRSGDLNTAMMRFNQSWLLDSNYYQPYWGFASILLEENKPEKASVYFDKALSLINNSSQETDEETKVFKPWIFVDAARAYGWTAGRLKETDVERSKSLYEKANKLIDEALMIDPKVGRAYKIGAAIAYDEGDYKRAWSFVKKAQNMGVHKFDEKFISKLSKVSPELK